MIWFVLYIKKKKINIVSIFLQNLCRIYVKSLVPICMTLCIINYLILNNMLQNTHRLSYYCVSINSYINQHNYIFILHKLFIIIYIKQEATGLFALMIKRS